ncbi:hypothetical protein HY501_00575 [Candidatus Woesearchaeota archaeon]|nr:hypothetical protein [Candidatus Woesearchaeota archaeon]
MQNVFLRHCGRFYQLNAQSGEFRVMIFRQTCYFEAANYHEKIHLCNSIEEKLEIKNAGQIPEEDFLNLYGTLFKISITQDTFEVTGYLAQIQSHEQELYNQRLRLGYFEKDGSYFIYRRINPYAIYHEGERYHFEKAVMATRVIFQGDNATLGPLFIQGSYSHPGLASENKERQTLCLGDINYSAIREAYKDNALKQWLHLFSIGENALKGGLLKEDCFHPLKGRSAGYGSHS